MDDVQFVESYAILTLGVDEKPIPSIVHLQKELFILSKMKPEIQDKFNFEAHYMGPFSSTLQSVIDSPVYNADAFGMDNSKIFLNENGEKAFKLFLKEYSKEEDFQSLITSLKFIRKIYDKLTSNELLFLVYDTYPEFLERSRVSDELIKNRNTAQRIITGLFTKNMITSERFEELKEKYLKQ
jgi:hypothetical protein